MTEKVRFIQNHFTLQCIALLSLFLTVLPAGAQTGNPAMPLSDWMSALETRYGITFSYESGLTKDVFLDPPASTLSLEQSLNILRNQFNFQVDITGESYFLVTARERTFCLKLIDVQSGVALPTAVFSVNNQVISHQPADDRFQITYAMAPNDTLRLSALGYYDLELSLRQMLNGDCPTASMIVKVFELGEFKVSDYLAPGVSYHGGEHSLSVDLGQLSQLPGETDGDVLASITALPGVTSPDTRAGNIHIRSSAPDQSFLLFDDIPIYHKGHYFGTISPYNPAMVDKINVYRSGYGPRRGGRVGGAIELNTSDEIPSQVKAGVGVNTLYGGFHFNAPIVKDKFGLMVAARRSLPSSLNSPKQTAITNMIFQGSQISDIDLFNALVLENFDLKYTDVNVKSLYQLSPNQKIEVSGIYVDNNLNYAVGNQNLQKKEGSNNDLVNLGGNLTWKSQWSKRWLGTLSVTFSDYEYSFARDIFSGPDVLDGFVRISNKVRDQIGRYELAHYSKSGDVLEFGYEMKRKDTRYHNEYFANNFGSLTLNQMVVADLHSPYVNYSIERFERLKLRLGVRGTQYSEDNTFRVEPRAFARYELGKQWLLKGSSGFYNQYVSEIRNLQFSAQGIDNRLWMLANDDNVDVMTGHQHMTGILFYNDKWTVDVEGYYKEMNDVTYLEGLFLIGDDDFATADIKAFGIDFLIKRQFEKLTTYVSYTYSSAKVAFDTLPAMEFVSEYDQPHVFNLVGMYQHNRWKVSASFRYSSGLTDLFPSAPRQALPEVLIVNGAEGSEPPIWAPPPMLNQAVTDVPYQNQRFPDSHQLDLSMSYTVSPIGKRARGVVGLSLLNVYNRINFLDQAYRASPQGAYYVTRYTLGFAPNLMLSLSW